MVDQPSAGASRSFKIRGHTRQRRTTKPYARPSEVKKKSLLDTMKEYLSPSWLFGYFQTNDREGSSDSDEDDVVVKSTLNELKTSPGLNVSHQDVSSGEATTVEGDDHDAIGVDETHESTSNFENPSSQLVDKGTFSDNLKSVFSENNNEGETWTSNKLSVTLSGELIDERENEDSATTPCSEPNIAHQSAPSYSSQELKRKPLPSILHSRTPASSLFQHRETPLVRSHGNAFLTLKSTTATTLSLQKSTSAFSKISTPSTSLAFSRTRTDSTGMAPPQLGTASVSRATTDDWKRQPVASSLPQFSLSTFVTPLPRSFAKKRTESSFYPGPVTYGGALRQSGYTCHKRQRRNSPGSEVYQPVRKQQIRAKPLPTATHGGSTSQTAQRILEALESVSSPLKDVRRIPSPLLSPSASPLSFSPSKLRTKPPPKSKVGPRISSLQAKLLGGVPVELLSTPQVAKVIRVDMNKAEDAGILSSPVSSSEHPSKQPSDHSLFAGLKDTVLKKSLPTGFTPKALPTSLSPMDKTSKTSGKMKSAPRGATHYSSKNVEDEQVVNPLPEIVHAVPLPVDPSKNMSSLLTANKPAGTNRGQQKVETNNNKLLEDDSVMDRFTAESSKNGFIFSAPKPKHLSIKEALSIADEEVSFSFSQPVPLKDSKPVTGKSSFATDKLSQSPRKVTSLPSNSDKNSAGKISVDGITIDASLAKKFAPVSGENCVACTSKAPSKTTNKQTEKTSTEKVSQKDNSCSDLAQQFAKAEGSWDCTTCMINNNKTALKCAACNSEKPGSEKSGSSKEVSIGTSTVDFKARSVAPANTWECEVCMVRNNTGQLKCLACGTVRPVSTNNDLKAKFAAPVGSWECGTCMVWNKASDVKCVACQSSKPGSESDTGAREPTFSFGTSSSTEKKSSGGFTFGSNTTTTSSTPFSFGQTTTEPVKSDFTFGQSIALTQTTKPEFKFGNSSSKEQNTTSKFTFGAGEPAKEIKSSDIVFGKTGSSDTLTQRQSDSSGQSKQESNVGTADSTPMTIAQLAAAGKLKVPGMKDTAPNSKVSTGEPSPFFAPPENQADVSSAPLSKQSSVSVTSDSTVKSTPFTFGAGTVPVTTSSLTTEPPQPTSLGQVSGTPGLIFGKNPTSKPEAVPFNFSAQTTSGKTDEKPSFNFAASVATTKENSLGIFKFGASDTAATEVSTSTGVEKRSATPVFSFSDSTTVDVKSKGTPVFKFGAVNGPSSVSVNSSSAQSQVPSSGSTLFSLSTSQPPNTASENQNSIGGEDMDADSNSNHDNGQPTFSTPGGFSFATQQPGTSSGMFGAGSAGAPGNLTGGFNFAGSGSSMPSTFQFGAPSNTNTTNTPGGYNFTAPTAGPVGSSPFLFGGPTAATASDPSNSSTTSAGFNFAGAVTTLTPSFNFGPKTGSDQPVMFNVGAAQNTPAASGRLFKKAVRRNRR